MLGAGRALLPIWTLFRCQSAQESWRYPHASSPPHADRPWTSASGGRARRPCGRTRGPPVRTRAGPTFWPQPPFPNEGARMAPFVLKGNLIGERYRMHETLVSHMRNDGTDYVCCSRRPTVRRASHLASLRNAGTNWLRRSTQKTIFC